MSLMSAMLSFALVAGLVTITPGLDTAMVLRATLRGGRAAGLWTMAGIILGVLIWGLAAALGVSALLAAATWAYDVLRYVGAAYMVWLGARLLWGVARGRVEGLHLDADTPALTGPAAFRGGLLTNLLNPKVGAFYIALLPQFLPHDTPTALAGTALALVHCAETVVWLGGLACTAHAARRALASRTAALTVDGITGIVLVAFGLKLATQPH